MMSTEALDLVSHKKHTNDTARAIKAVVWDLDNTVWDGVLLEDGAVPAFEHVVEVIRELDRRGILQSISSKNDHDAAMSRLGELGLAEYFLYPQIGWGSKSEAVKTIAASINIGMDTIAFIDDQAFEREEVAYSHPTVLCLDAAEVTHILEREEFVPRFITEDSSNRRLMYMSDIRRNELEREFEGPKEQFLATLDLKVTLARATEDDLQRAEELTRRTHQLNTTGYTYNYDELRAFMNSPDHVLLIASLEDRFGTYGRIGLCLIERSRRYWTLKLLLMSCRVMSRGIGTIMISYALSLAKQAGVPLRAEFVRTERNRMMYVTYRLSNFRVITESNGLTLFENDCSVVPDFPVYASICIVGEHRSDERLEEQRPDSADVPMPVLVSAANDSAGW